MIVSTEPCGICECCKVGRRCARVLYLSPRDATALARVNSLVGETGRTIQLRSAARSEAVKQAEAKEPTVTVKCPRCDDGYELLAYIANTLKLRGHPAPPCDGYRYGNESMLIRLTPNGPVASMYLMANTQTSNQALTAETITDEQCRELRGHPTEVHARVLRNAAESRAGRKFNAARDKAFAFFGSTDVEQAARANAIARAEADRAKAVNAAVSRWRAACAKILNARAEVA